MSSKAQKQSFIKINYHQPFPPRLKFCFVPILYISRPRPMKLNQKAAAHLVFRFSRISHTTFYFSVAAHIYLKTQCWPKGQWIYSTWMQRNHFLLLYTPTDHYLWKTVTQLSHLSWFHNSVMSLHHMKIMTIIINKNNMRLAYALFLCIQNKSMGIVCFE